MKASRKSYYKANVEKIKARVKAYNAVNAESIKARSALRVVAVVDGYIASLLNLPKDAISPELLALKREHLKLTRKLKRNPE